MSQELFSLLHIDSIIYSINGYMIEFLLNVISQYYLITRWGIRKISCYAIITIEFILMRLVNQ